MPLLLAPATAPPDLRSRLADLRRRWRRLVLTRGICMVLAVVLLSVIFLGSLDYAIHLPALVRAVVLVGLLIGGAFAIRRIVRQLSTLNDEVTLALRVEDHFPGLNDALASTIELEKYPGGSDELREATRRFAVRESEDCDFRELLDRRPARRTIAALVAAGAIALPLLITHPVSTSVALVRLLDPFGDHPWPPQTVLTIDAPDWLARGEPFLVRGTLDGVIPERAMFGFALDGTSASEQPVPILTEDGRGSLVIRLEPNRVPRNFRYRVRANDSETSWRTVRVLTPPQLAAL